MRRSTQIALVLMGSGVVGTAALGPALFGCDTEPDRPEVCSSSTSSSTSYSRSISSSSGSGTVRTASASGSGETTVSRGGFGSTGSAHASGG